MAMDCCTNNAAAPVTRQKCVEDLPTPSELEPLFQPLTVGGRELATRVVYAPLARCRALGNEPSKLAIQYYSGATPTVAALQTLPQMSTNESIELA